MYWLFLTKSTRATLSVPLTFSDSDGKTALDLARSDSLRRALEKSLEKRAASN